jgi:hypothetical protein
LKTEEKRRGKDNNKYNEWEKLKKMKLESELLSESGLRTAKCFHAEAFNQINWLMKPFSVSLISHDCHTFGCEEKKLENRIKRGCNLQVETKRIEGMYKEQEIQRLSFLTIILIQETESCLLLNIIGKSDTFGVFSVSFLINKVPFVTCYISQNITCAVTIFHYFLDCCLTAFCGLLDLSRLVPFTASSVLSTAPSDKTN